jgi:hypothetical protein
MTTPRLTCPTRADNDGAFALHWSGGTHASWRVEENGVVLYEGPDRATTVTGRPAGTYEYRVVAGDEVSAPCVVEVTPPSLALAFALAGVGAAVFAAVLALVLVGDRRCRREDAR